MFPEYTPDRINEIRSTYAREGRYEEVIALFHRWEAFRGEPKTHEDSAAWYTMKSAYAYTFFDLRQLDSAEHVLKPVLDVSADSLSNTIPADSERLGSATHLRRKVWRSKEAL
jgi:hypothetical protein